MKKIITAFAMTMALFSAGAMAQGTKGLMFGGKGGVMKPQGSGNDAGYNIGAVLGRPIQGDLSWEAELMLGISDGEQNNKDWSINSVAGYAVYRSAGDIHVKAKFGVSSVGRRLRRRHQPDRGNWHRLPHGARHSRRRVHAGQLQRRTTSPSATSLPF